MVQGGHPHSTSGDGAQISDLNNVWPRHHTSTSGHQQPVPGKPEHKHQPQHQHQ